MSIGKRISELRKKKGYSQEYIAEQLGVSRQAVSKWEKDLTSPDTKNLIALSVLLDTSVDYIAMGDNTASDVSSDYEGSEADKTHLHNVLVSWSAFSLIFGIALTMLFPFYGPVFIVVAIILMIFATTLE